MDEWSFFRNQIHLNKEIINIRKKSQQSLQQFREDANNLEGFDPEFEAKMDSFMAESMKALDAERQHNASFEKSFKASSKRILGTEDDRDEFKKVKWNNHEDKCLSKAAGIVQRYLARGGELPRQKDKNLEKVNPERLQEDEDSNCLYHWRLGVKGSSAFVCSDKVKCYLDMNMPHWRDELSDRAMNKAIAIVARYKARQYLSPTDQDKKDNKKLAEWKKAVELKNQGPRKCPDQVKEYLDENIPGWRVNKSKDKTVREISSSTPGPETAASVAARESAARESAHVLTVTTTAADIHRLSSPSSLPLYNDHVQQRRDDNMMYQL